MQAYWRTHESKEEALGAKDWELERVLCDHVLS